MISDLAKSDKGRGRLLAALGILVLTPDGLLIRYGQLSTRQVRTRATCARARLFVQRGSRRANSVRIRHFHSCQCVRGVCAFARHPRCSLF